MIDTFPNTADGVLTTIVSSSLREEECFPSKQMPYLNISRILDDLIIGCGWSVSKAIDRHAEGGEACLNVQVEFLEQKRIINGESALFRWQCHGYTIFISTHAPSFRLVADRSISIPSDSCLLSRTQSARQVLCNHKTSTFPHWHLLADPKKRQH